MTIHYWRDKHKQTYTPDFIILLQSGRVVVAEVKCLAEMISHRVQAKTEGLLQYCHEHGFGLLLTDGKHTPDYLLKGKVNRKLEKEIVAAVTSGVIRRMEWQEIKKRMPQLSIASYTEPLSGSI